MSRFGFNTKDVTPSDNSAALTPIPNGDYYLMATTAQVRPTKDGRGQLVFAEFTVMEGPYAKRKIFQNFNIVNPNEIAQNIGRAQLKAWCEACGKYACEDTDELLNAPFKGRVGIEKGTGGYADRNIVATFLPATAAQPAPAQVAETPVTATKTAAQAATPLPTATKNPWDV
jgi:hypothetical protein